MKIINSKNPYWPAHIVEIDIGEWFEEVTGVRNSDLDWKSRPKMLKVYKKEFLQEELFKSTEIEFNVKLKQRFVPSVIEKKRSAVHL